MDPRMYPEQSIQQPGFNPQNNIHMEIQQQRPHITYTYDLPSAFPHPPVDDFQADINHPNSYYNAEQSDTFMTPFQLQNLPQGAQLQEMEQFQRLHQMLQMQQLQQMQHMQRIHHMQQINAQNPQGNINGPHSR